MASSRGLISGPLVDRVGGVVLLRPFDLVLEPPHEQRAGIVEPEVVKGPVHIFLAQVIRSSGPAVLLKLELEVVVQVVRLIETVFFLHKPGAELLILRTKAVDVLSIGSQLEALIRGQGPDLVVEVRGAIKRMRRSERRCALEDAGGEARQLRGQLSSHGPCALKSTEDWPKGSLHCVGLVTGGHEGVLQESTRD